MFGLRIVFRQTKKNGSQWAWMGLLISICAACRLYFLRPEIVSVWVIHQHILFGAILRALNRAFYSCKSFTMSSLHPNP